MYYKEWILGGEEIEESCDWLAKKPFNLKALGCFRAFKQTTMYGKMLVMWEIVEEEKFKFVKSICRIVTFCDDNANKQSVLLSPTIEYTNEFRVVDNNIDGTIMNRRIYGYKNHGALPAFIETWIQSENSAIVHSLHHRNHPSFPIPSSTNDVNTSPLLQKSESGISLSFPGF